MRRTAILVVFTVLAPPAMPAASLLAQQPAPRSQHAALPSDSAVRALIAARVDSGLSTGIVVGLLGPDGARRVVAYGSSGSARPLDAASVFEIGSITKTFTGVLLAEMVARGDVRLDDPVATYLPSSVTVPSRDGRQITLVDLATQSSGLPSLPGNLRPDDPTNPYADYTPAQMYEFLSAYKLPRAPGAEYEYSNLGTGLLGHALALHAGLSFEELLRQRLLDPLGMTSTGITLTPAMRERLALGHDEGGAAVPNWDLPTLAGAGALRSTADDMLTYLAANLAADLDSTNGALAPVLRAAHVRRRAAGGGGMAIGLGWHLRPTPDSGVIVWHNGGTGGYRSFAGYDPARRTAVVVLTNSGTGHDDIGFHSLAPAWPLQPPGVPAWVGRTAITLPTAVLDRYVGEYELAPTFHIVVTREGDGLFIQATGQPTLPVFAERDTAFYLKGVDARITFQVDAAGRVTGLVLHQNGVDQPAPRVR